MITCKLGRNGTVFITMTTPVEGEDPQVETWSVAPDPRNRHYQMYLKWVDEGNTPEPADPEPEPPEAIVIKEGAGIGERVDLNTGIKVLEGYLDLSPPTAAQTVVVVKILVRVVLTLIKRIGY